MAKNKDKTFIIVKTAKVTACFKWAIITGKTRPTVKLASQRAKVEIPIPKPRMLCGKISDNNNHVVGETQDWKKAKNVMVRSKTM